MERLFEGRGQILNAVYQVVVLRDRQRDAGDVDFLEGVAPDQRLDHLAGDGHDRHRVEHGVGEPGDQVRRPWSRSHQADPRLAGSSRIPFGGQCRPLLEPHQDVVKPRAWQRIVERNHRSARISENRVHTLVFERAADDLRPGQHRTFGCSPARCPVGLVRPRYCGSGRCHH